jgi:glyoxylase-like metal-dependent hydrolase (beta-lactamase superfamily II)
MRTSVNAIGAQAMCAGAQSLQCKETFMPLDRFQLGRAQITRIEEMLDTSFKASQFFPDFSLDKVAPHLDWMSPTYYLAQSDALVLSMHSWIVDTGKHLVLIDACIGNDKERMPRTHWHRMNGPYLQRMRAAGIAPEDIDFVMCTHMHADHLGWNTRLENGRWVPTFPNARYVFARTEYEHWLANPFPNPIMRTAFDDSVLPVIEAGRAMMVDESDEIDPALSIQMAPGHTPGNLCIHLDGGNDRAVFAGDVIHHPIQAWFPDWSTAACMDPTTSVASRRGVLDYCASEGALLLPAHFAAPHGGRVEHEHDHYRLIWREPG